MNDILKWTLIIVVSIIFIVIFKGFGFFLVLFFLFIYGITTYNKKHSKNKQIKNDVLSRPDGKDLERSAKTSVNIQKDNFRSSSPALNDNRIKFHSSDETVSLFGYTIVSPLIYTSENTPSDSSYPFVIYLTSRPDFTGNDSNELGYWPKFSDLSKFQKGNFIKWLANGKKDSIDIGYVFIYYYGLEHRALVEQKNHKIILFELIRLYNIFSDNPSFRNYSANFISYLILKINDFTPEENDTLIQHFETLSCDSGNFPVSDLLYKLTKGKYNISKLALSSTIDKILCSDYGFNLGKRQRELFLYYVEKEIEALDMSELYSEIDASFRYQHASPHSFTVPLIQYKSLAPVSEIKNIYRSCKGKWQRGFQNVTIRKIDSSNDPLTDVEKCAYLSSNLKFKGINPNKELFDAKIQDNNCIEIGTLMEFFSFPENGKLTIRQSEFLVDCCESLGYKIEPNAYLVKRAYKSTDKVILFTSTHKDNIKGSNFLLPSLWFDLGYKVALEDDSLEDKKAKLIQKTIQSNFKLSIMEKERLEKRGELYSITKQVNISDTADKIKSAEPDSINLIATYLISLAALDNIITIDEQKLLEKVFKQLSLPTEYLTKCLNELQLDRDVVTVQFGTEKSKLGSVIPRPNVVPECPREFKIDPAKLAFILDDTAKVQKSLNDIFAEESEKNIEIKQEVVVGNITDVTYAEDVALPSILAYQLIQKDTWSSGELKDLFKPYNLMLNNAVEMVNEWTDNTYGDYLLEEDDGIFRINKDFAEQLVELGVEK